MNLDDTEIPDLQTPDEGLETLMSQMTREWVDATVKKIQGQLKLGVKEEQLFQLLRQGLPNFDKHSLYRVLQFATGAQIVDDFPAETIVSSRHLKPNTVELEVHAAPRHLLPHSLVRYGSNDWLVLSHQDNKWMLKLLE